MCVCTARWSGDAFSAVAGFAARRRDACAAGWQVNLAVADGAMEQAGKDWIAMAADI